MRFKCRAPRRLALYEKALAGTDLRLSWLEVSRGEEILADRIEGIDLYGVPQLALVVHYNDRVLYVLLEDFDMPLTVLAGDWTYATERGKEREINDLESRAMSALRPYLKPNLSVVRA